MAAFNSLVSFLILAVFLVEVAFTLSVPEVEINADYEEGKINCDGLICPAETDVCSYTEKNSIVDQSAIIVLKRCLDSNGQELAVQNSTFTNYSNGRHDVVIYTSKGVSVGNSTIDSKNYENQLKSFENKLKQEYKNTVNKIKDDIDSIKKSLKL